MPMISDQDFAAFQQWKSGGGSAGGGAPAPASASAWQPPGSGDLPPPTGTPGQYGGQDYAAQNAEIQRRALAAQHDPNSPTYITPEQRAQFAATQAMQAKANPGWTWNGEAGGTGYWTADAAHNTAGGTQAFNNSWQALGKANPEAFDVPMDAQGRPIDARTGQPMQGGQTAAQRAQPQGAPQWQPPPGSPPANTQQSGAAPQAPQAAAWAPPLANAQRFNAQTGQAVQSPPAPPAAGAQPLKTWDPQKGWQPPTSSPGGTY